MKSALLFAERTLCLVLALRIRIKLVVRNPEACGQACVVHLEVFQLYLQVPFVMHVLLRQEDGVAVVASLTQNLDGDLHVKVDFALAALLKHIAGRQQVHNVATLSFTMNKEKKAHSALSQVVSHLDELLQLGAVLEFGVAVQQQCGVVCVGQRLPVQGLQVRGQVVDPLSIQELPDDV